MLTSNGEVLTEVGGRMWNVPEGILVSTVVCSCDDPFHHVVDKGEYRVQIWEGTDVECTIA